MINPSVGIDLGTTNTVIAIQSDDTGPCLLEVPQPFLERKKLDIRDHIKSVVEFETLKDVSVGAWPDQRNSVFRSIKSHIGTNWRVRHPKNTKQWITPSYISAHILRLAFETILKRFPEWDQSAVITVPASFNTMQRHDTESAIKLAGFKSHRLLDEPTAAFYYYLYQNKEANDFMIPRRVLIFDFGGGTLDVSILEVSQSDNVLNVDPVGRSRYNNLGGDDIDMNLAAYMLGVYEFDCGKPLQSLSKDLRARIYRRFIREACLLKESFEDHLLNPDDNPIPPEFNINETLSGESETIDIKFRRILDHRQYAEFTGVHFGNSCEINVYRPISQAEEMAKRIKADYERRGLHLVLYTGGASRMQAVRECISRTFAGINCASISHEDACNTVALGAANFRYHQKRGNTDVRMTNRLLECVLMPKQNSLGFVAMIPPDEQPGVFKNANLEPYLTPQDLVTLKIPLFLGAGVDDHQVSPLGEANFRFDRLIPKSTQLTFSYKLNENKTFKLKAQCKFGQEVVESEAMVRLAHSKESDGTLAAVNRI